MATEEQRAAAYRAQAVTRAQAKAARCALLAGSASARAALQAEWQPLVLARLERDQAAGGAGGIDAGCVDEDCCGPNGPMTN